MKKIIRKQTVYRRPIFLAPYTPRVELKTQADIDLLWLALEKWMLYGKLAHLSATTLADRRFRVGKLVWYLENEAEEKVANRDTLRGFMLYLGTPNKWGNSATVNKSKVACSATGSSVYYRTLRTFFRWMVSENLLDESPLEGTSGPRVPRDHIIPLSMGQVELMFDACTKTDYPKRNAAILAVLVDTGMRVGELVSLRGGDIDLKARRIRIRDGKMGKDRIVPHGSRCAEILNEYLSLDPERKDGEIVWIGEKEDLSGRGMTENGIQQVIRKLGRLAGIRGIRVSPHTLRHTFATEFLRNGGNAFSLQYILGHADFEMTQKYIALSQADIDTAMTRSSPFDGLPGLYDYDEEK